MSEDIKIYLADLAAYNNGKLHGVWIDATLDMDLIWETVKTMLKSSPEPTAEEYAIHDYEGFGCVTINEYEGLESVNTKALFIEEHNGLGAEVLNHWCGDLEDARKSLEENYAGVYASLADYARGLTEDASEVPAYLELYIDYEKMGRDMELGGDIFTLQTAHDEVHVFWGH